MKHTLSKLITLLVFLVAVFAVALLGSWVATFFFNDNLSSIYLHAAVGIVGGLLIFAHPLASLTFVYLLIAYQDEQLRSNQGGDTNAANLGGYAIGYAIVLNAYYLAIYFGPGIEHGGKMSLMKNRMV